MTTNTSNALRSGAAGRSPAAASPARPQRRKRRAARGELMVALLFILPAGIGFTVFYLAPTIRGLYLSFTDYNLLSDPNWIGIANYIQLFQDPLFWNAVGVTIEYVLINITVQTVVAIGMAVLMHRLTKSIVVRGMLLLPFLISNVIAAMVWFLLLDYQVGLVNSVMDSLGITKVAFFADSTWAIPTIALVNVWRHMGYTALLVFAGLQMIPTYVYEAAAIDGSSEWRSFWKITMPLLRPIIALVLVVTVTGSFQVFDTVAVTTRGGPINATRVLQYYIYQTGFGQNEFGYASAMSVVLLVILAVVALFQLRLMRANDSDLA